jgi:hypothetical protein
MSWDSRRTGWSALAYTEESESAEAKYVKEATKSALDRAVGAHKKAAKFFEDIQAADLAAFHHSRVSALEQSWK